MILDILMSTWGKLITTQDFLLKSDGKFAARPPVVTVEALYLVQSHSPLQSSHVLASPLFPSKRDKNLTPTLKLIAKPEQSNIVPSTTPQFP
jgi:hypothetical protein